MTNILVQWHTAHMLKNPVMQSDGRPKGSPVTGICNTFRMLCNKCNLRVASVKLLQVTSEIWACYKLVARLFLYCKLSFSEMPQITAFQKLLALTELKWLYPCSRGSSGGVTQVLPQAQMVGIWFCVLFSPRSHQCEHILLLHGPSSPEPLLQQVTLLWFSSSASEAHLVWPHDSRNCITWM